jgi:lipoprotein-anchoring transpeptidase ErfK/SrfK
MKNKFDKLSFKNLLFIFPLTFVLFSVACEQPTTTTTNTTVNANANLAANSTIAANTSASPMTNDAASASTVKMPVTLPVLDAMFADENFAGELKTKLQLSDEQIDKLKSTARQAVGNLREESGEGGSTRVAMERSGSQIREIIGEEKAGKLFEMVSQRWNADEAGDNSGGNNGGAAANNSSSKPNAIPTDTRVVVNAPAYRMDLFQDGKLTKSYKIGIGYPEFPLPTGVTRKANTIIFNPTWTTPDEPWVEASNKVKVGQVVAAGDKLNPLGPIKIPIGSPSLIHGGKSPAKLGGFASHGCVGLTNTQVQDFAMFIAKLSGTELMPEEVKNYAKQKTETKNFKLEKTVPVELRYETIVVENGKLRIFRDVYEKGTNTEENLRAVLDSYGVSLDSLNEQKRKAILDGLKQMALDATGSAADGNSSEYAKQNTNQNANMKNASNSKADASQGEKVTRGVKGKKEVSFDIAELKGKGYPAPVNYSQS